MALWAANGANANAAPKAGATDRSVLGNTAFGNVTSGAFRSNVAIGVFAVDVAEMANVIANGVSHPGWVKVVQGTGPATSITISAAGGSYVNGDVATVASTQAGGNATFTVGTNATGNIVSLTLVSGGAGFKSVATSAVTIANSTGGASAGSGATLVPVLGGRAGRVNYETLVAMGSITGDASDDTTFPDT
jgi:hypothetical protein